MDVTVEHVRGHASALCRRGHVPARGYRVIRGGHGELDGWSRFWDLPYSWIVASVAKRQ
jgi:hypothetical protein